MFYKAPNYYFMSGKNFPGMSRQLYIALGGTVLYLINTKLQPLDAAATLAHTLATDQPPLPEWEVFFDEEHKVWNDDRIEIQLGDGNYLIGVHVVYQPQMLTRKYHFLGCFDIRVPNIQQLNTSHNAAWNRAMKGI